MKKYFGLLLFSTIFQTALAAETVSPQVTAGWNALNIPTLKKDIAYLASDSLQGRLALEPGDTKALHWIAQQFAAAGLQPGTGSSYLQAVPLIRYVPDRAHSYVQMQSANETKRWQKPDIVSEFPKNINVSGQVVFVGYGITAPALHYDDYQNIDVRGKIVLLFEHEPQETVPTSVFNGTGNTIYAVTRIKVLNAQQHGAIAVLIAPEPNRNHPSNQQRLMNIGGSTARVSPLPSFVRVDEPMHVPFAILSDAVAQDIAGKNFTLAKRQAAIDHDLKPQSANIPYVKITLHDQIESRSLGTSYNVVGLLTGSDPQLKKETIIISAHHDHDGMSGTDIWHGADDNASGTTGVVTLAHAIATNAAAHNGLKPKRSILFVVFAAEEQGLLGSFYLADHPLRPLATTRAMLNFDMIGRNETPSKQTDAVIDIPADTTNRLNLIGAKYSPDYNQIVTQENKYVGLTLDHRYDAEHALNTFFRSDQFPFVLKQVPAFWWFTGFHPDYHHTTDTADKINYAKMQNILRLAYLSAYAFADETTPPKFIKNPGA